MSVPKTDAWNELNCPLCAQEVPINTDVGKGREFLERTKGRQRIRICPICGGLADIDDRDEDGYICRECPGYQRE